MNAYFDNTSYGRNIARGRRASTRSFGDGIISFICAVIGMLTCSVAVKIEKTVLSVAVLVAFFGVVGGIECGSLSWFAGILLCAILSFIEYATLKSIFKKTVG